MSDSLFKDSEMDTYRKSAVSRIHRKIVRRDLNKLVKVPGFEEIVKLLAGRDGRSVKFPLDIVIDVGRSCVVLAGRKSKDKEQRSLSLRIEIRGTTCTGKTGRSQNTTGDGGG